MSLRSGLGLVMVASVLVAAWFLLGTEEQDSDALTGGRRDSVVDGSSGPGTRRSEEETHLVAPPSAEQATIASERFTAEGIPMAPWVIEVLGPEGVSLEGVEVEIRTDAGRGPFQRVPGPEDDGPPWKTVRTDSRGEARVHVLPPLGVNLKAEAPGYCGVATAGPERIGPGARIEVPLEPVRPVRVEVVDAAGRPVEGARVTPAMYQSLRGPQSWTDSEGTARLLVKATDAVAYAQQEFTALVTLPAKRYKAEPVAWAEEGETVARVEVERGVLLRVKVFDEGVPATGSFTLRWKVKRAEGPIIDDEPVVFRLDAAFMGPSQLATRRFDGPETVVTGFASGATYTLELLEEGRCTEVQEIQFESGPILRDVVFNRGPLAPVVLIPLVDERMSPVVEGSFRLEVSYPDDLKPTGAMRTVGNPSSVVKPDRDGVIRVDVDARRRVTLVLRHHGGAFPWIRDETKALLRVEQSPLVPGEVRRLDPVTIPDQDVLVAGRVVDADGRPVGGAVARVAPGRTRGRMQVGELELAQNRVRTADDGTFTIRRPVGELTGEREYRVFARLGDVSGSDLVPFEPGQRDVSVRVVPTGGLEGRLISPPEVGKLRVQMARNDSALPESLLWALRDLNVSREAEEDGSFKFEQAIAGRYDVTVWVQNHEVLKVEGVEVVSGRVVRDPRLDGVDVAGHLWRAVVFVKAPDGSPVVGARLTWRHQVEGNDRGRRGFASALSDEDGQATTILPDSAPRVLKIAATGFLPFEEPNPVYPMDAVLDPGCTLTFVIGAEGPLPVEGRVTGWRLSLIEPGAAGRNLVSDVAMEPPGISFNGSFEFVESSFPSGGPRGLSVLLDPKTGRGTMHAVAPGTYEVHLMPRRVRSPAPAASVDTKPLPPIVVGTVIVNPGDRDKTLRYTVPRATLVEAMN